MEQHKHQEHKLSGAGLLISLGIIYGDIGTSPLYVFKSIIGDRLITEDLVLGGLSCVFWTLTLLTTIKYVIITLRADNKGEGGIFSLYSLVKNKAKWTIIPATIGGAALLADGIITPPFTVSAAIEGLAIRYPDISTLPIVLAILMAIFIIQQFGTNFIGKAFGPVMWVWFTMLAVLGSVHIAAHPEIIKSINPWYAYHILSEHPQSFAIVGGVFLCTTGAEALYSDLGHCGRANIRISWMYVKLCLMLNYWGQGVWLLSQTGHYLDGKVPFYSIMPEWFLFYGIAIATLAAIIASQALISGSFTLISEAVRLNLWPKVKINYPSLQKGQIYVPSINLILFLGCLAVLALFQTSEHMEHAYGLSITITMLMTTILVCVFLKKRHVSFYLIVLFAVVYFIVELTFLAGNLPRITHGGWFTVLLGSLLFVISWTWYQGRRIRNSQVNFVDLEKHAEILKDLSEDNSIPKFASQLVYLTNSHFKNEIEQSIIYSILQKQPKRADVYWFLHVSVTGEPYTSEYKVTHIEKGKIIRIDFRLGFRIAPAINVLFRKAVEDLVSAKEVDIVSRYTTMKKYGITGDFKFIVLEKDISDYSVFSLKDRLLMRFNNFLRRFSVPIDKGFGLDMSFVNTEKVPLAVNRRPNVSLTRMIDS
ncbi:KUP/HAK/KT family potassium transporter [Pedobacter sp. SYSU D00535]|uniref:KUP/HAK/KT family potassium transporter n=1 Tax=Pedobacter sp. SYSU D00535 TaxID=2810308 RepID=UPI001A97CDDB|nr:KUP/HAK/KT family potassium transporter [Pedobacter sp. SYSU D00535]